VRELVSYLPEYYDNSSETATIQRAIQPEIDLVWSARDDLLLQLNPRTATWGLDYWEAALGLQVDRSKDLEFRRTRVVAKLRGRGTTTVALIKSVSESFSNGAVDVRDIAREYRVEIHFVGTIGIPPNLEDLRAALDDIMPAHLDWIFVIYYRTHEMVHRYTHGELRAFQHTTIREGQLQT
jgi:hypothetical protein